MCSIFWNNMYLSLTTEFCINKHSVSQLGCKIPLTLYLIHSSLADSFFPLLGLAIIRKVLIPATHTQMMDVILFKRHRKDSKVWNQVCLTVFLMLKSFYHGDLIKFSLVMTEFSNSGLLDLSREEEVPKENSLLFIFPGTPVESQWEHYLPLG